MKTQLDKIDGKFSIIIDGTTVLDNSQKATIRSIAKGEGTKYRAITKDFTEQECKVFKWTIAKRLATLSEKKSLWHLAMIQVIKAKHNLMYVAKMDQWYHYSNRGFYIAEEKVEIEKIVLDYLDLVKISCNNLHAGMKALSVRCAIKYESLNNYPNKINCSNGILDLETYTITPHKPTYYFTYQYAVKYTEETKDTPTWDRLLTETTKDGEMIKVWMNDLFNRNRSNEFALWIVGPTNSGASTFISLFEKLFECVGLSTSPIGTLGKTFGLQNIAKALLNIDADVKEDSFGPASLSILKKLIDCGGKVDVNIKNGPQTTVIWKGFMLNASNNLPIFGEGADRKPIFKRIYFANFPNTYDNNPEFITSLKGELNDIFSQIVRMPHQVVKKDVKAWIKRNEDIYIAKKDVYLTWTKTMIGKDDSQEVGLSEFRTRLLGQFPDISSFNLPRKARHLLTQLGGIEERTRSDSSFLGLKFKDEPEPMKEPKESKLG